jgi:hypothetical protein
MGLDMYVRKRKEKPEKDVDFESLDSDEQVFYWRKHPNLHGWMEALYQKKGGSGENFNLDTVLLTNDDIDKLEKAVNGRKLPKTEGFFFGRSRPEDKIDDLKFIERARQEIKEGFHLYYTSWW